MERYINIRSNYNWDDTSTSSESALSGGSGDIGGKETPPEPGNDDNLPCETKKESRMSREFLCNPALNVAREQGKTFMMYHVFPNIGCTVRTFSPTNMDIRDPQTSSAYTWIDIHGVPNPDDGSSTTCEYSFVVPFFYSGRHPDTGIQFKSNGAKRDQHSFNLDMNAIMFDPHSGKKYHVFNYDNAFHYPRCRAALLDTTALTEVGDAGTGSSLVDPNKARTMFIYFNGAVEYSHSIQPDDYVMRYWFDQVVRDLLPVGLARTGRFHFERPVWYFQNALYCSGLQVLVGEGSEAINFVPPDLDLELDDMQDEPQYQVAGESIWFRRLTYVKFKVPRNNILPDGADRPGHMLGEHPPILYYTGWGVRVVPRDPFDVFDNVRVPPGRQTPIRCRQLMHWYNAHRTLDIAFPKGELTTEDFVVAFPADTFFDGFVLPSDIQTHNYDPRQPKFKSFFKEGTGRENESWPGMDFSDNCYHLDKNFNVTPLRSNQVPF